MAISLSQGTKDGRSPRFYETLINITPLWGIWDQGDNEKMCVVQGGMGIDAAPSGG